MIDQSILILRVITYFALIPIVYRALTAVDFSKVFRKHKEGESQMTFFIVVIVFSKLIGDFFLDVMEIFLKLFGVL
ncbi:MAG TPA: DUF1146 family protein [Haloplasmataceae bacterium]|mgnify:CR=1 FL=1